MSDTIQPDMRPRRSFLRLLLIGGAALPLLGGALFVSGLSAAEEPRLVPAASHDIAEKAGPQTAIFAGGCFWGIQGVFQHVEGVLSATSGYAGGSAETATYQQVETVDTGHAEAVQVVFDPQKISYGKLMQIFFSAAHDPTQVDRQGPDSGKQYRSALFPLDDRQAGVARGYISELEAAGAFTGRIATRVELGKTFYPAEDYHQDFMVNNPADPYILINEVPKIESLKRFFPEFYREKPVLVFGGPG